MNVILGSRDTAIKQLSEIAVDARESLIEQEGGVAGVDGYCHENALFLADYLDEYTRYTPYIRWGAIDYKGVNYSTLKEAEEDGAVHFWAEVDLDDGKRAIVDLFTMHSIESDIQRGDVYVGYDYPPSYQPLSDTLFEYDPNVIDSSNLLSYTDYEHLTLVLGWEPID